MPIDWNRFLDVLSSHKHLYAFEFRDPTWYNSSIYQLLRRYQSALCIHDWRGQQSPPEITAEFTYIRFHGATGKYQGNYTPQAIENWAELISRWSSGLRGIYIYFNNDQRGYAVKNAQQLKSWFTTPARRSA